jgi:SAM-dependent methyltransferase
VEFKDHFSTRARAYAEVRPSYPAELFEFLASVCDEHSLAWDCATGNGQAALGLAEHFERVVATDASAEQIGQGTPHPRVEYRVARAEESGLPDGSVDLVTVAQAMHWLDAAAFFDEANRVLVRGGVLAVWAYGLCAIAPGIDEEIASLYGETLGAYWPPERRMIDEGYRNLALPFGELATPPLSIERPMTLAELEGYLRTWSATRRYMERHAADPISPVVRRIAGAWGPPESERVVRWPLFLRAARR